VRGCNRPSPSAAESVLQTSHANGKKGATEQLPLLPVVTVTTPSTDQLSGCITGKYSLQATLCTFNGLQEHCALHNRLLAGNIAPYTLEACRNTVLYKTHSLQEHCALRSRQLAATLHPTNRNTVLYKTDSLQEHCGPQQDSLPERCAPQPAGMRNSRCHPSISRSITTTRHITIACCCHTR
jgi:hypothetical protein